jgi:hypothetical protein
VCEEQDPKTGNRIIYFKKYLVYAVWSENEYMYGSSEIVVMRSESSVAIWDELGGDLYKCSM